MKSNNVSDGTQLEIKRLYLPGVILESTCPNCGQIVEMDLGVDYLSYPYVGSDTLYFYHSECDNKDDDEIGCEWKVEISLDISVQVTK